MGKDTSTMKNLTKGREKEIGEGGRNYSFYATHPS